MPFTDRLQQFEFVFDRFKKFMRSYAQKAGVGTETFDMLDNIPVPIVIIKTTWLVNEYGNLLIDDHENFAQNFKTIAAGVEVPAHLQDDYLKFIGFIDKDEYFMNSVHLYLINFNSILR